MVRRRKRRPAHTEPAVGSDLIDAVRRQALPLRSASDLDPLLDRIGDALPSRYDALLYLEQTEALRPLHDVQVHVQVRDQGEVPETYPSGM